MTRYVLEPDVALMLAQQRLKVPSHHRLLAPTLLRSQVLAQLFGDVQRGLLTRKEADQRLDHLRGLQVRLLGDRVLQQTAWRMAKALGWKDTFVAEYVALTQLRADALLTRDLDLRRVARSVLVVAAPEDLLL